MKTTEPEVAQVDASAAPRPKGANPMATPVDVVGLMLWTSLAAGYLQNIADFLAGRQWMNGTDGLWKVPVGYLLFAAIPFGIFLVVALLSRKRSFRWLVFMAGALIIVWGVPSFFRLH